MQHGFESDILNNEIVVVVELRYEALVNTSKVFRCKGYGCVMERSIFGLKSIIGQDKWIEEAPSIKAV